MERLSLFQNNIDKVEPIIDEFKKVMIKRFPYDVKDIEIIYNNRGTALILKVKNHGDKDEAVIKIGNFSSDKWCRVKQHEDTIKFKGTMNLRFVNLVIFYTNKLSDLFKELQD